MSKAEKIYHAFLIWTAELRDALEEGIVLEVGVLEPLDGTIFRKRLDRLHGFPFGFPRVEALIPHFSGDD